MTEVRPARGAGQWLEGIKVPQNSLKKARVEPFRPEALWADTLAPFRRTVAARPDAIAIDDGVRRVSFGQLLASVEALAEKISTSTAPGQLLMGVARNDAYFPVMIMAAILAGRPLTIQDVDTSSDRQAVIYDAARPSALLVPEAHSLDLAYVPPTIPRIVAELNAPSPAVTMLRPLGAEDVLAFPFTSGSTGKPKGLAVPAASLPLMLDDFLNCFAIDSDDVVLSIASPSTMGNRDAIVALFAGAKLRLLDPKTAGMLGVLRALREENITFFGMVPSVVRTMMTIPGASGAFKSLRLLSLVGEALSRDDLQLFRSELPDDCEISLVLGSSEAGQVFQWFVRDEAVTGSRVPLGYLVAGRRIALIDEDGQPALPGEAGELVISDRGVAVADLVDGELDITRFARDEETGFPTYATGDMVRRREDGLYEFVSRRDRMVKIRGLRVELDAIEAVLKSIPTIADAVVVTQQREERDAALVAFVVLAPGQTVTNAEMRKVFANGPWAHVLPSVFHRLEEMPRLHNGKADLVRLSALEASLSKVGHD